MIFISVVIIFIELCSLFWLRFAFHCSIVDVGVLASSVIQLRYVQSCEHRIIIIDYSVILKIVYYYYYVIASILSPFTITKAHAHTHTIFTQLMFFFHFNICIAIIIIISPNLLFVVFVGLIVVEINCKEPDDNLSNKRALFCV